MRGHGQRAAAATDSDRYFSHAVSCLETEVCCRRVLVHPVAGSPNKGPASITVTDALVYCFPEIYPSVGHAVQELGVDGMWLGGSLQLMVGTV
jgi:hypothetical protein